jgi:predicted nucleotidyltransferase
MIPATALEALAAATPEVEALPAIGDFMEQILNQLTRRLTKTFGERLVSVMLYGSAASPEYNGDFSDLNVLCVLKNVGMAELRDAEPVVRWWREQGNPSPLLLSEEEVRGSTDCFPIEFHDMKQRRRLLAGVDLIENLEVDYAFYRAQVEHELRAKLLRLRQKAAGLLFDKDLLRRLLVDSVSTFCILMRHSLRLSGHESPHERRAILMQAQERFGIDPAPFALLLDVREKRVGIDSFDPFPVLEQYITQISIVAAAVDRMDQQPG